MISSSIEHSREKTVNIDLSFGFVSVGHRLTEINNQDVFILLLGSVLQLCLEDRAGHCSFKVRLLRIVF